MVALGWLASGVNNFPIHYTAALTTRCQTCKGRNLVITSATPKPVITAPPTNML